MLGRELNSDEANKLIDTLVGLYHSTAADSYTRIKELLDTVSIPLPVVSIPKNTILYRSRPHHNVEFFQKIDDIKHRTDIEKITNFGRANEPYQSIFYCADDAWIAFVETSTITRDQKFIDKQILTTGA